MICIDASIAAKWLFPEEYSAQALALLEAAADDRAILVAPPLLRSEVVNVVFQRTRARASRAAIEFRQARRLLRDFEEVAPRPIEPERLYDRALEIAHDRQLRATYDAVYVALAEALGATMWTADQALIRETGTVFPFVTPIAECAL